MKRFALIVGYHLGVAILSLLIGMLLSGFIFGKTQRVAIISLLPSIGLVTAGYLTLRSRRVIFPLFISLAVATLSFKESFVSFDGNWSNAYASSCVPFIGLGYLLSIVVANLQSVKK